MDDNVGSSANVSFVNVVIDTSMELLEKLKINLQLVDCGQHQPPPDEMSVTDHTVDVWQPVSGVMCELRKAQLRRREAASA